MSETVYLLNMFPDYEPPEEIRQGPFSGGPCGSGYPGGKPQRRGGRPHGYLRTPATDPAGGEDILSLYGLRNLEITLTHPATELSKIEPEELRDLFVDLDPMTRPPWPGLSGRGMEDT